MIKRLLEFSIYFSISLMLPGFVLADGGFRDPTTPLIQTPEPRAPSQPETIIRVQSVVGIGDSWAAVVNRQLVEVGDRIGGHRVDAIDQNGVWFVHRGQRRWHGIVSKDVKE